MSAAPPKFDLDRIILDSIKRRDELRKSNVACPECGERQQVELRHITKPAQWKCRTCKTTFEHEPSST